MDLGCPTIGRFDADGQGVTATERARVRKRNCVERKSMQELAVDLVSLSWLLSDLETFPFLTVSASHSCSTCYYTPGSSSRVLVQFLLFTQLRCPPQSHWVGNAQLSRELLKLREPQPAAAAPLNKQGNTSRKPSSLGQVCKFSLSDSSSKCHIVRRSQRTCRGVSGGLGFSRSCRGRCMLA